jgi:hypothetical protein
MDLPETIVLDIPNLLTAASVIVALLSALYSLRSAKAAHRQAIAAEHALNETRSQSSLARDALIEAKAQTRISIHGPRLESYKVLLSFSSQLTTQGVHFKQELIWALWEHAQVAEFYFSELIALSLKEIVDLSLAVQSSREEWSGQNQLNPGERQPLVEASYAQLERLRLMVASTDKNMRKELHLVETKG